MRALADEALAAGAVGFSTSRSTSHLGAYGLPVPSRAADVEEIRHLARALRDAGHGTFEATWGPDLFVDEFAEIAGDIGRPVTWAAIMATARQPGYAAGVAARTAALGGRIFPQIAGKPIVVEMTLADPFPFANVPAFNEILALPHHARAALYADPAWAERADAGLRELWGDPFGAGEVAASDRHPELVGAGPLGPLAAGRGVTAIRLAAELAVEEQLTTRFRVAMTNDDVDQVDTLLRDRNLLLGLSDAGAHTSQLCDANYATHLLGYWHRQRGTLSLEEAVWRLTGQPAEVYELADRGVVRAGAVADLVAFDPERVGSGPLERVADFPAGADRLVARSTGIEHVWVAGTAIDTTAGSTAGPAPGRLLRHGR
jgi:N-acyl-D-aspartate/D-glutamate deacylase